MNRFIELDKEIEHEAYLIDCVNIADKVIQKSINIMYDYKYNLSSTRKTAEQIQFERGYIQAIETLQANYNKAFKKLNKLNKTACTAKQRKTGEKRI